MRDHPKQVLLTFDVEGLPPQEDFLAANSLMCVKVILDLLEEKDLSAIFFLTGSGAEQIREHPDLVERLSRHEIGYHSSSHSVKPRIIEYTDVPSYEKAMAISLRREVSHINPETGQIEGKGGIFALRETFPRNDITCFRAPFLGWSPPHSEALKKLGIRFDFSSGISDQPVSFRGITFYPCPVQLDDGIEATLVHRGPKDIFPKPLTGILLRRKVTVLSMHPAVLLAKNPFAGRNEHKIGGNARTKFVISLLQFFLHRVWFLQKSNLIEINASLSENWQTLRPEEIDVKRIYEQSVQGVKRLFNSNPRFILSHFMNFFGSEVEPKQGLS